MSNVVENQTYIERARAALLRALGKSEQDWAHDLPLLDLYTLLVLTKGTACSCEDIHEAWAITRQRTRPEHPDLVPFEDLSPRVDEVAFPPDRDRAPWVRLDVTSKDFEGDFDVCIDVARVPELIQALAAQVARAGVVVTRSGSPEPPETGRVRRTAPVKLPHAELSDTHVAVDFVAQAMALLQRRDVLDTTVEFDWTFTITRVDEKGRVVRDTYYGDTQRVGGPAAEPKRVQS